MGGIAAVPFFDIWGKSLPFNLRGRFFGYRQLWGGVLAIGSGLIVKNILGNNTNISLIICYLSSPGFLSCLDLF